MKSPKSVMDDESEAVSLEERAYAALKDALIQGGFPAGQKLSIRRIATALGVSPMPARAALRRLAAERCLDIAPGGGAVVPLITRAAYQEIMRVRLLLEPEAAAAAVPKLAEAEIDALAALAEEARAARAASDEETYRRGDRVLHQRFYAAAGLPLLFSLIEIAWMRRSPVMALARRSSAHRISLVLCPVRLKPMVPTISTGEFTPVALTNLPRSRASRLAAPK